MFCIKSDVGNVFIERFHLIKQSMHPDTERNLLIFWIFITCQRLLCHDDKHSSVN